VAYFFGATLYIDFAYTGTSNAAADDVTNLVTHKIFNTSL